MTWLSKLVVDGDQAERFPFAVKQQHYYQVVKSYRRITAAMQKYLSIIFFAAYLSRVKIEFGLKRGYKRFRP
jgi:hypothetical protein